VGAQPLERGRGRGGRDDRVGLQLPDQRVDQDGIASGHPMARLAELLGDLPPDSTVRARRATLGAPSGPGESTGGQRVLTKAG
jgi:hypothetical protein